MPSSPADQKWWALFPAALSLIAGVTYLGWYVDRTEAWTVVAAYALAFTGYAVITFLVTPKGRALAVMVGVGLVLRFIVTLGFPALSDDVYRFLWDGYLINAGENPFTHLPGYYLEPGNSVAGLTPVLFKHLNSPEYHTIYPPVAQGVFAVATWLSPGSWSGAALIIQSFLLTCELGTLWLLWKMLALPSGGGSDSGGAGITEQSLPRRATLLIYWLNPLIIVEICGNLHFEGAMVFFLLLSYYFLRRSRWLAAGGAMAAAVASKLLPLLLLPYLIRRLWGRAFWLFSAAMGFTLLLLFAPLLATGFLEGFGSSLDLYFRKFEFNASFYYLARAWGFYEVGWNMIADIGPALAKVSALIILALAWLDQRTSWRSLPEGWMFAFVIYLLFATTVHPWYLSVPLVLCCFTHWRFPVVWSFLITLTYVSYGSEPYAENLWLVGLEYGGVLAFGLVEWLGRERALGRV